MQTGFQALQNAIDESKARQSNLGGGSLTYFSWGDGDRKIIRFLTDDIITGQFHNFIITNDGKTKGFLIDPDKGDFVAKYASPSPSAGGGLGWQLDWRTKQAGERKPRTQTVGIAVLRDLVPKEGGGFDVVDHFEDVEVDGKKLKSRVFGVIQQSHKLFWGSVIGYNTLYGTICDRDYMIVRTGSGLDTDYRITPVDPVEGLRDIKAVQEYYGYGRPWNKEDPERFLFCPQTLAAWGEYYSGEDRAKHWLIPKTDGGGYVDTSSLPPVSASADAPFTPVAGQFQKDGDEAQAIPAVAPSTTSDFSSLRDKLLANR